MGIMVVCSLCWVMQDFVHQQYHPVTKTLNNFSAPSALYPTRRELAPNSPNNRVSWLLKVPTEEPRSMPGPLE